MSASRNRTPKDGFPSLGLSDSLLTALATLGYEEPTPIQRDAIPQVIAEIVIAAVITVAVVAAWKNIDGGRKGSSV